MTRRALLDTNVVLDVLLNRQPHAVDSGKVWQASDAGLFDACIASFSIPTIYYICRRQQDAHAALAAVDQCLAAFEVAPLYRECILAARRLDFPDFEDALQVATGLTDFAGAVVTRNPTDFAGSPIRIFTPREFLQTLSRA